MKYSPYGLFPPIHSGLVVANTPPLAGVLAVATPLTYSCTSDPLYVSAKCVHVPTTSGVVALVQVVDPAKFPPPDGRSAPLSLLPFRKYASGSRCTIVRQPLCAAVGCTQASNVIPVLRFRLVELFTNTRSFTPSKLSALPNRPGTHAASVTVPVFELPDASPTVTPVFSSNAYAATRPGAEVGV